jgi:hypothetical protein
MFVSVVQTGSFSAAAHDFKIGQSAVSKMIAGLEDRLSARLFFRAFPPIPFSNSISCCLTLRPQLGRERSISFHRILDSALTSGVYVRHTTL